MDYHQIKKKFAGSVTAVVSNIVRYSKILESIFLGTNTQNDIA